MRILSTNILSFVNNHIIDYPTPNNLSYFWSFGSLLGLALVVQLITGVFLVMHYTADISLAFDSVSHIMRDVNYGWLLRFAHANGAFFFLGTMYLHIARGFYYTSYAKPSALLWCSGVVIFLLTMATAFLGYVLPWGQMSLWGAVVITNLVSAIPVMGQDIVYWLWGGFSVDNATLSRFFSLHYLLPFIISALSLIHLYLLHTVGSNNPSGINVKMDSLPFYPYFYVKDLFSLIVYWILFSVVIFWFPYSLGHTENFEVANPMVTPNHIEPEAYFLPFYAILSSIPNKLAGVAAMIGSILIWLVLPFYANPPVRSSQFSPIYKFVILFLFMLFVVLGWLGSCEIVEPYITISQICTALYFAVFLIFIPVADYLETSALTSDVDVA